MALACGRCRSKEHSTDNCPHEFFSTSCERCGSVDHVAADCPRGFFSTECGRCGSKEHSTDDCPHEYFSTQCESCGSVDHVARDCPRGFLSTACEHCGSRNHNYESCPHRMDTRSMSTSDSSSSDTGCAQVIGWLVGVAIIAAVAIWLAVNVVLPVVLLNSALILTIMALFFRPHRTLLSGLAVVGGCYMLIDIGNGWFSINFVRNVVKDPHWITGFVYVNAAAVALSTWQLVQPMLATAATVALSNKRNGLLLSSAAVALVGTTGVLIPVIYHTVRSPFVDGPTEVNTYTAQPQVTPAVNTTQPVVARDERFVLPAVISDSDGYTNVRELKSASSGVVATVQAGEEFYTFHQTGQWWQVRTNSGKSGYMHVSRIQLRKSNAVDPIAGEPKMAMGADSSLRRHVQTDAFTGNWEGYYPNDKNPTFSFAITKALDRYKIAKQHFDTSSTLFATIQNGKLVAEGDPRDFYKLQPPTIESRSDGALWYVDGADDVKMTRVNVPVQPKANVTDSRFVGTWRVTTCCAQHWPYRIANLGGGRFQLDRGLFREDGTENYDFSQPLVLRLVDGRLEFDGAQGDTGYRSKVVLEVNAADEMVFKEYVGGVVASPYNGPRIR